MVKNGSTGACVWLLGVTFDFLQPILKGRPKTYFKSSRTLSKGW